MAFNNFFASNDIDIPMEYKSIINSFDSLIRDLSDYQDINFKKPISIDLKKPYIKISRILENRIILNHSLMRFGDGSRNGKGVNNKGNSFEKKVIHDLSDDKSLIYSIVNKELIFDSIIDISTTKNQRPLLIEKDEILITSNNDTFCDLKLNQNYISLKYGKSVSFFQLGIKKFFNFETKDFKQLETFCCFFNLDEILFKETFENKKSVIKEIDNFDNYKKFISSAIGKGYWILHGFKSLNYEHDFKFFFVDENWNQKFADFKKITIYYGGQKGNFKRISIKCQSDIGEIILMIRPTNGTNIPTHLTGQYKIY